jgi:hemerythrin-like domain-containing protein
MDIFGDLVDEHHTITRVMDAFMAYLDSVEAKHDVDRHDLFRFVTFFSDYADGIHHAKEEAVLFPALERHGYAKNMGPLAHIREQHSHERALFARLKRAATDKHAWSDERIGELLATGRELVEFERAHMKKEDELLYPEAKRELAGDATEALDKALVRFRRIHDIEGYADYLGQLARELSE